MQRPLVEDCILAKMLNSTIQTWTCVDDGSKETVWQNSMTLGTTIVHVFSVVIAHSSIL